MKNAFEYEAELAALREELAASLSIVSAQRTSLDNCVLRYEAAEQRNAELVELLRDIEETMDLQEDSISLGYDVECRMAEVLRPVKRVL